MKRLNVRRIFVFVLLFCMCPAGLAHGKTKLLWQIGESDNDNSEFGLAPSDFEQFGCDGFFVVGQSDLKRDWPYVQPGPADGWAGRKKHTFTIVFGIKRAVHKGQCRLVIDLVNTNHKVSPKLRIEINGHSFVRQLPLGGPGDSLWDNPSSGQEHRFDTKFPANFLKAGENEITITTIEGNWILYDWIGLDAAEAVELLPMEKTVTHSLAGMPVLIEKAGTMYQLVEAKVDHFGEPAEFTLEVTGREPDGRELGTGVHTLQPGIVQTIDALVPAVEIETPVTIALRLHGKTIAEEQQVLKPVRKWEIYVLHHSHVDIGYTELQTIIERKQCRFLEEAVELARETADYPAGAQLKWNPEVLWAVESYLKQAKPEKREAFIDAVKKGWIGLDAFYGSMSVGMCRPEEIIRQLDYARRLRRRYGVKIDSAIITDVPGLTWGYVPVLAQSGVKYLSMAPNGSVRIGYTRSAWDNRPFYWVSPCGRYKVLCWQTGNAYYPAFHNVPELRDFIYDFDRQNPDYPYNMIHLRDTHGDNSGPLIELAEVARKWNSRYAYPKFILATTSEMFHEFERRYGEEVPAVSGDFTPYWEDGAVSSALEIALTRATAERLVQAEALWAMLKPANYSAEDFYTAWRNVILFNEHTWGARWRVYPPGSWVYDAQWHIKRSFAVDADVQSRKLLNDALAGYQSIAKKITAVNVFNTSSWPRTDLVVLAKELVTSGDVVKGPDGKAVPSQRLSTGELAFLAQDVPAFGAKKFTIHCGEVQACGSARAQGASLSNGRIVVTVDEKTGAIVSLTQKKLGIELVDGTGGMGLNDYFYVPGRDPADAQRNGQVKITVKERGPLVAALLIESEAPGCHKLSRELRVVDGLERLDIVNVVDKQKVREKEGVHFGFAFNVPEGVMRMDISWAVIRPEADQLPGANKNFFAVQRWVDVSNQDFGVTWATVDAPLVEVGAITAETPWLKTIAPSQTLYSYVMNNYWVTNFRADQEGPTTFRYSIKPHRRFDGGAAARFGIERNQPLVVVPVDKGAAVQQSLLSVKPAGVIVSAFKPSEDGKAWIIRLFNAGGQPEKAELNWAEPGPEAVWLSDLAEREIRKITGPIDMSAYEFVTLRASLPGQ